ncbi:MAG: carbamate kinase [Candidatus Cloacimonas sp.]|nr:carbamate kinase [Candidatus Cloacimonadota bacterium]
MKKTAVLALGGNAILKVGEKGTVEEQLANTRESMKGIVGLIKEGYNLAITHGNGPQVGNFLIQQQAGISRNINPLPLSFLNAATEGTMGYMIEQSLDNRLQKENMDNKVMTVITMVEVDKNDQRFNQPSKPVGPFYTKEEAERMKETQGWHIVEDSGRGYRQVVPSPLPLNIPKANVIKGLVESGTVVIACGGGGIPYYLNEAGEIVGIDAVIDKDHASALLARVINADLFIILTGVEKVAINYNTPNQIDLDHLTVDQAKQYFEAGEFPAGSMGPKIRAAIDFIENGGSEVIITSVERIVEALKGQTGTKITL